MGANPTPGTNERQPSSTVNGRNGAHCKSLHSAPKETVEVSQDRMRAENQSWTISIHGFPENTFTNTPCKYLSSQ